MASAFAPGAGAPGSMPTATASAFAPGAGAPQAGIMPTATASAFAPGAGAPGSMPSATVASAGTGRYDGGAMPTVSAGAPGGALPVASAASPPGQAPPLPCLFVLPCVPEHASLKHECIRARRGSLPALHREELSLEGKLPTCPIRRQTRP